MVQVILEAQEALALPVVLVTLDFRLVRLYHSFHRCRLCRRHPIKHVKHPNPLRRASAETPRAGPRHSLPSPRRTPIAATTHLLASSLSRPGRGLLRARPCGHLEPQYGQTPSTTPPRPRRAAAPTDPRKPSTARQSSRPSPP